MRSELAILYICYILLYLALYLVDDVPVETGYIGIHLEIFLK